MTTVFALGLLCTLAAAARSSEIARQQDAFLSLYYVDEAVVRCSNYRTANGARFATDQWWLAGFRSGVESARNARGTKTRTDLDRFLERVADHCQTSPTDTLAAAAAAVTIP